MKTSERKDMTTEQNIVAAAEQLFLEKGYALTSTVEIAKKAGCNQALVHYYFRTKENLFQAIFEQKVMIFMTGLTNLDHQNLPFEEALTRIIESHFDILAANPRLPFLILNELTTNPDRVQALKDMVMTRLDLRPVMRMQMLLDEEIRKGKVRPTTMLEISLTMASLNVMLFIARPIVCGVLEIENDDYNEMIARRRKEHVDIILRSIRP
jgi:AcrR family transcriptional regulator